MRRRVYLLGAALLLSGAVERGAAQGIYITPALGAFLPGSDVKDLRDQAEQTELDRSGTLGLGLNLEAGWLRGSVAYATGANISERGIGGGRIGTGSVLAVAVDAVARPLPRLFVQPYLLGGIGYKRQDFSFEEEGLETNPLPEDRRDVAFHFGVGADLMFGRLGVMAEITDYVTRTDEDSFGQHDAFALVGLRYRLGGR